MKSIFGWASVVHKKENMWKFTDKSFVLNLSHCYASAAIVGPMDKEI
jgi:hypothetical protein